MLNKKHGWKCAWWFWPFPRGPASATCSSRSQHGASRHTELGQLLHRVGDPCSRNWECTREHQRLFRCFAELILFSLKSYFGKHIALYCQARFALQSLSVAFAKPIAVGCRHQDCDIPCCHLSPLPCVTHGVWQLPVV